MAADLFLPFATVTLIFVGVGAVMPRVRTVFSEAGSNTLSCYLLHMLACPLLHPFPLIYSALDVAGEILGATRTPILSGATRSVAIIAYMAGVQLLLSYRPALPRKLAGHFSSMTHGVRRLATARAVSRSWRGHGWRGKCTAASRTVLTFFATAALLGALYLDATQLLAPHTNHSSVGAPLESAWSRLHALSAEAAQKRGKLTGGPRGKNRTNHKLAGVQVIGTASPPKVRVCCSTIRVAEVDGGNRYNVRGKYQRDAATFRGKPSFSKAGGIHLYFRDGQWGFSHHLGARAFGVVAARHSADKGLSEARCPTSLAGSGWRFWSRSKHKFRPVGGGGLTVKCEH